MTLARDVASAVAAGPEALEVARRVMGMLGGRTAIVTPPWLAAAARAPDRAVASVVRQKVTAGIFDVDGVLLNSPHERAWREALDGFADSAGFTTAFYQAHVAGRPRLDGARATLAALHVPDAGGVAELYAERKQTRLEGLIKAGCVTAYPDAIRFLLRVKARGWKIAAASSSKNANPMMQLIPVGARKMLLEEFDANVCGRDLERGKPAPDIYLLAAFELKMPPPQCFVVEDAPAGIAAARAGGMTAIGVARHDDAAGLWAAGADNVVTSLDDVTLDTLAAGLPCPR